MDALEVFAHHLEGLAEALERGKDDRTPLDVASLLSEGKAQLWGDKEAVIVTQLRKPYVDFWLATGKLERVLALSHEIFDWAKGEGYSTAVLVGRRGWKKALADDGWSETNIEMQRAI